MSPQTVLGIRGKPLLASESGRVRKKGRGRTQSSQAQAFDAKRHFPSRVRSDFTCKTIYLAPDKDKPQGAALSPLKSRSVRYGVTQPRALAWVSPAHKEERRNESWPSWKSTPLQDGRRFGFHRLSPHEQFSQLHAVRKRNLSKCKSLEKCLKQSPKNHLERHGVKRKLIMPMRWLG